MASRGDDDDAWSEPSLTRDVVERRRDPRGIVRGVGLSIEGKDRLLAVEASRKGFFAEVADPEAFRLGDLHDVSVERGAVRFSCRVEVVRKEIAPRRGVALRIQHIAPAAEQALLRFFDEV